MSNAIKIGGNGKKKSAPKVAQSIPANFYKNYVPPKTPSIKPMAPPAIPDFDGLPKISPSSKGININKTGSYSLTRNKHPMSLPVRHGIMGPKTPFDITFKPQKKTEDNSEAKEEPNSLEQENKKLKVGSFTCFDIMTSPLKQLAEDPAPVEKDNASATSASTFASQKIEDVAPDDDEEDSDAEGGGFDLE